ncbi:MAG: 30S ribosome-binding factor RbfA [Bradymonadales bacterium]|jgi:ribosome-binding factor A
MSKLRQEKVAAEIKRVLASFFLTGVKDPRLLGLRIMHIKLSADFSICRIYWLPPDNGDIAQIDKSLSGAASYIRGILAEELNMRHTPKLAFHYDETFEKAQRMDQLLADLRKSGQMGE